MAEYCPDVVLPVLLTKLFIVLTYFDQAFIKPIIAMADKVIPIEVFGLNKVTSIPDINKVAPIPKKKNCSFCRINCFFNSAIFCLFSFSISA